MKRKLIKIGKSTLLLSLPRDWVVANNLSKGDEIEATADHDKITFWCSSRIKKDKLSIDVTEYKDILPRLIYSLYRSGFDEIELKSGEPGAIDQVKSVIWRETVGFEIMEHRPESCRIVNVSGKMEDMQNVLRRLFLVTLTMGQESAAYLGKGSGMENILYLEQENNRLTTMLIRALNKHGSYGFKKIGPVYYIIQELEKIGDQYKYMAQHFTKKKLKTPVRPGFIKLLEESNRVLRMSYELFYDFKPKKAQEIKQLRNELVDKICRQETEKISNEENVILRHAMSIATRSFDLVSSIFILRLE